MLERSSFDADCTIGDIYIDSVWECFSLEDKVREVQGQPVSQWKIKGETAIPEGSYNVIVTMSNRFKRDLPLLESVPGFEGIRIHPGNTSAQTEGCILVGISRSAKSIGSSKAAFSQLFDKIKAALDGGDTVTMEVG